MMELTKERLTALSNRENVGAICSDEIVAMARQLLAEMEQEPVAWEVKGILCHTRAEANIYVGEPEPLYAVPQLPQPLVAITQHFDTIALDTAKMVMCDVNRRDEFLGGDIQLLSRIQCRIDEACRAAMLQDADCNSPVIPDWQTQAEKMAELYGSSFVLFRNGESPQCADPTKVIISFTDEGLGHGSAAPQQEVK